MQSNMQFLNLYLDANGLGQIQVPVLYAAPIISNGLNLESFQKIGGSSLNNGSNNSLIVKPA